jgi:uncharacterized membrane protein (DUF2068 family)
MKSEGSTNRWLLIIGAFKIVKGLLLVATGIGALRLLHKDVAEVVAHWIEVLRVDPDNRYIYALLTRALNISDRTLEEISIGTFIYAALFLTEGSGLLLGKRWAEYFTIIVTTSLLPLEFYEMIRHATITKALVILLNLAIVAYLVFRLRRAALES